LASAIVATQPLPPPCGQNHDPEIAEGAGAGAGDAGPTLSAAATPATTATTTRIANVPRSLIAAPASS
jgi:hypothetical protein